MAEADTLGYWNKLAAIRAAQPVTSAVGYGVKVCNAGDLSGDAIYTYRCPGAWLEYAGTPNAATAQLVFPRDYSAWVKNYLRQALSSRPNSAASAEFRVVWALDVWAHVNYALFALPLPWSDIFGEGIGAVPEIALPSVVFTGGPRSLTGENAAGTAWSNEKAAIASSSSVKSIKDAAAASRLNPAPFSELALKWCRAPGSRSRFFQRPNPLWPLLLAAVQPWSAAWSTNWIGSRGNKDSGDVARWKNDPVMLRATMQWRLWSAQDWGYIGYSDSAVDPSYWPDGMGKADAVAALGAYITHVKGEATAGKITFRGTQAYPNLAFGLESVSTYASKILSLDFDTVISAHLGAWLTQSAPRVNADGSLAIRSDGLMARQPLTRTDYADYFRGLRKAISDRMRLALSNPALACAPSDSRCLEAAKQGAKVQAAIQSSPLAPVQNLMQRIADKLVVLIGAAVGGGYEPVFVIRDPFSRTFNGYGYRLVADGSMADVFFRVAFAVEDYKGLLAGLFSGQIVQAARVQRGNCKVHWTRSQLACEICEGEPLPACAADVPGLAAPAQSGWSFAEACDYDWIAVSKTSPYAAKLDDMARLMHRHLCTQLLSDKMTQAQYDATWALYLKGRFGRPSNLFSALVRGFLHSSNPLG